MCAQWFCRSKLKNLLVGYRHVAQMLFRCRPIILDLVNSSLLGHANMVVPFFFVQIENDMCDLSQQ